MRYLATILVLAFVANGTNAQIATLTSLDADSSDYFGTSVGLNTDGTVLIVGASGDDEAGEDAGAAYIFERSGTTWNQTRKFMHPGAAGVQHFGLQTHISAAGNRALITVFSHSSDGLRDVLIYSRESNDWTLEAEFGEMVPEGDLDLGFETALSTDGVYVLATAYREDQAQIVVHVFQRTGDTWKLQHTFDMAADNVSLSAEGQYALLSKSSFDTTVPVGHIFAREGSTWILDGVLNAPDGTSPNVFLGYSGALSGDGQSALIGAPQLLLEPRSKEGGEFFTGGYLFERTGEGRAFVSHLDNPPGTHVGDDDGWDVALNFDGTRAMAASPAHHSFPSSVQVFDQVSGQWSQVHTSDFEDFEPYTYYGDAITLSEDGQWGAASAPFYGPCCNGPPPPYPGYVRVFGPENIPVELTSFTAQTSGNSVHLAWQTSSETNNAGFEVQTLRSDAWTGLGFVEGHGTTTEAQSYTFDEVNLDVGTHTFRLKQIDFDGAFEYSQEVEAIVEVVGTHQLSSAYPNPFNPQSQFRLAVARDQHVTATLYNALGRRVAVLFNGQIEGQTTQVVAISGEALPSGTYFVRVLGVTFVDTLQITLAK